MLHERLAFRYACAFLNVFIDQISADEAKKIYTMYTSLEQNRTLVFFLELPMIKPEEKINLINTLFKKSTLAEPLKRLVSLLIKQKRGLLLVPCLKYIWWLFQQRTNTLFFDMVSSHPLSFQEQQQVKNFLEHISKKKVLYDFKQNKLLIAGIRLQSDQLLWEYSINKLLQSVRQEFQK